MAGARDGRDGLRKVPAQARSRRKVELILEAARDLMLSKGMASFSIDTLAKAAGVAVGTIYQFFPSKDAVLNELARQSLAKADTWLDELQAPGAATRSWSDRLDMLVARMAEAWQSEPTAQIIWDPAWTTPEMRAAADQFDDRLARIVEGILADAGIPRPRRKVMAAVIVESAASVLDRWVRLGATTATPGEVRTMLAAYVAAAARR